MGWVGPDRLPVQAVPDRIVDARELASEMRVSVRTVYRLHKQGMPSIRFSPGCTRFRLNEAMQWAERTYTEKAA
jgi:predicted DNA-binding transcriptional regulator YafY